MRSRETPYQKEERLQFVVRRGSFVAYCAACTRALHFGDEYTHSPVGTYCGPCWRRDRADVRSERELGHHHPPAYSVRGTRDG